MTLREMSADYRASAQTLRLHLRMLRRMARQSTDKEELWRLKQRIARYTEMLGQMNELAELTEHYYERGYHRNAKYRV